MSGKLKQFPLLLWFVFFTTSFNFAQDIDNDFVSPLDEKPPVAPTQSLLDNLQKSEIVEIRLITDLDQLIQNKKTEDYQPAS